MSAKPNFKELAREWLVRELGRSDDAAIDSLGLELERSYQIGMNVGLGLRAEMAKSLVAAAKPMDAVPRTRTDEEAAAIERRIESDIGVVLDRLLKAVSSQGETIFGRFVAVEVLARLYRHLMNEDPQTVRTFDEPTKAIYERAVEFAAAKLISFHLEALKPHQS